MKRMVCIVLCTLLAVCLSFAAAACGGSSVPGPSPDPSPSPDPGDDDDGVEDEKEFTGLTFSDVTVTYDGTEHAAEVEGALPQGAKVEYTNNKGTDAGVYNATATVSCENYKTLTLEATLTILEADFDGVTFTSDTVTYDGSEHALEVKGTFPQGAKVEYTNNKGTDAGVYNATATVSCENYKTLTLEATLTILEADFDGVTFTSDTVTYDGSEHALEVKGTFPQGAKVEYTNNKGTDAGEYNATATVTCENYKTLTLRATLTINKADFPNDITFEGDTVIYDKEPHSIYVDENTLPAGTSVTYDGNGKTEPGEYTVTATLTNKNYNTKKLTARLNIRNVTVEAADIINGLLTRPDVWSFMPEALSEESMAYGTMPASDFTDFVSVDDIGKKFVGKQMNVVYDILGNAQTVLKRVDYVFMAGEAIAAVYQAFINDNPDDYSQYSGSVEIGGVNFSVAVRLRGDVSELELTGGAVSIRLTADSANNVNTGRIQITDGATLKYEAKEDTLKLAVNVEVSAVRIAQQLEFVRDDGGSVAGYVYEFYGIGTADGETGIKTTALIAITEDYTVVTGDKRESDDMKIIAYEEVYDSQTGEYIGAEVAETVKAVDYETLWYNLYDIDGFTSVKASEEQNGMNADTLYVNGESTPFETKNFGGFGFDMLSRRYDIEMKEAWYIVKETDEENNVTYSKEKTLIPMLFVNNDQGMTETFAEDVTEKNEYLSEADMTLPDMTAVTAPFESSGETYAALKEQVTYEDIQNFIGE